MPVIHVPYHLDERLTALPLSPDRVVDPEPAGRTEAVMTTLALAVAEAVEAEVGAGERPVVVSGDCSTALGIVAGLQRAGVTPSVVWFDAHGDVQTPETTASGYPGGFPVRQLVGGSDRRRPEALGLVPLAEEQIVLVDARDLDEPEAVYLATAAIRQVSVEALGDHLPSGPVYLHVDADVVNADDLGGMRFPTQGGPSLAQVIQAVALVRDRCDVVIAHLACTWHPDTAPAAAAELAAAVAGT